MSGFVKSNLPIVLVNHITSSTDLRKAFTQGFLEVDHGLAESKIDCEFSGSTCTVAYLKVSGWLWSGGVKGFCGRKGFIGTDTVWQGGS